jgi:hypothetical protein
MRSRSERPMLNRRRFVARAASLATAAIVPRHVLGGWGQPPPSEHLNVAVIGTGGQGITNIRNLLKHPDVNITAICDLAEFWDNKVYYYCREWLLCAARRPCTGMGPTCGQAITPRSSPTSTAIFARGGRSK